MQQLIVPFLLAILFHSPLAAQDKQATKSNNPRPPTIAEADFQDIKTSEDTLGLLGFLMLNDSLPEHRFASCKKFIPKLVDALKHKNSFDYPFERLHNISILYPEDRSFRIFTWQLYADVDEYHYFGAIQMNTPDLQLHPLRDRSHEIDALEFETVSAEKWYGAVYYNLKEFKTPEGTKYLVFGFDGHSFFNKRKVVDVLHFDAAGKPLFGAPVFVRAQEEDNHPPEKARIIKEYYAEASIKLNYDPVHEVLLFDHLTEMGTSDNLKMIPDGTYEGYELKRGKWVYIQKMFHETLEEAPRPSPVFTDNPTLESKSPKRLKQKDIFGN